ncbi:E4 ORF3 [Squirrel monkey adenovirus]|nr:E4 ORF3 [Squirrel monkey adenovirus]
MPHITLRLDAELALVELFRYANLEFEDELTEIIQGWKEENELQQIEHCSLHCLDDELQVNAQRVTFIICLKVHLQNLLDAVVNGLENRILFDLAVRYHRASGGRRCYIRELRLQVLDNLLDQ